MRLAADPVSSNVQKTAACCTWRFTAAARQDAAGSGSWPDSPAFAISGQAPKRTAAPVPPVFLVVRKKYPYIGREFRDGREVQTMQEELQ